jgi:hypothetical protein
MSIFKILLSLFESLSTAETWFTKSRSQHSAYILAKSVIDAAKQLKPIIATEDRILSENGGDAYFEHGELYVVLMRKNERGDDERVYHCFCEQNIELCETLSETVRDQLKLNDPPDENGLTYYIYSSPEDYGRRPYGIQLSRKEADFLGNRIHEVSEKYFGFDHE